MFGSSPQHRFLMGRRIVFNLPLTMPAVDAAKAVADFLAAYEGDKATLLFGYWDYGAELVVSAPATAMVACPLAKCEWCYETGRVTEPLGALLAQAKERGELS